MSWKLTQEEVAAYKLRNPGCNFCGAPDHQTHDCPKLKAQLFEWKLSRERKEKQS